MLTALSIRNVVLIERLELEFAGGLSVLTGETGAGKSILLDALGLALGQRAESGLVGSWANSAIVTAEFNLSAGHAARAFIAEQGLDAEGPIVLRRQLNADGKSRAFVNDQPVGVGLLRQVGARLVEVEGQFEAHGLMDASTHRDLLDEFADLGKANQECALHHRDWREAVRQLKQAREHQELAERDADFLRHALSELERIDPKEGEEETLSRERALLSSRDLPPCPGGPPLPHARRIPGAHEGHPGVLPAGGLARGLAGRHSRLTLQQPRPSRGKGPR